MFSRFRYRPISNLGLRHIWSSNTSSCISLSSTATSKPTNHQYIQSKRSLKNIKLRSLWRSWEASVSFWTTLSLITLLINISLTVAVAATSGFHQGIGYLKTGSCDAVKNTNTGLHILINVLSTALLAGSNFCMQCLSAPTRHDIENAHARDIALDIGIPSFRNLRYIKLEKSIIWGLLCLSSLPLHLFYNSIVYSSTSYHSYHVIMVDQSFLNSSKFPEQMIALYSPYQSEDLYPYKNNRELFYRNASECSDVYHNFSSFDMAECYEEIRSIYDDPDDINECRTRLECMGIERCEDIKREYVKVQTLSCEFSNFRELYQRGKLKNLSPEECMRAYARDYMTKYGNMILIPGEDDHNTTLFLVGSSATSFVTTFQDWMCSFASNGIYGLNCAFDPQQIIHDPTANFRPMEKSIDHCLAQPIQEDCSLIFNLPVALIVIIFNASKVGLMFATAFLMDEVPLLTIGDALKSFLSVPDGWTKNCCLLGASDYDSKLLASKVKVPLRQQVPNVKPWKNKRYRWFRAPRLNGWMQLLTPWATAYITTCGLTAAGFDRLSLFIPKPIDGFKMGLGSVRSDTILGLYLPKYGTSAFLGNVLVANVPQLVLSVTYFAFNATMTSMTAGREWSNFALKRKGLRVSKNPSGEQRHTYFLQLPYRYSIPLLVGSGVLHWLVSESLFLVALNQEHLDLSGNLTQTALTDSGPSSSNTVLYDCGFSPLGCVLVIVIATIMFIALIGLSLRKYPSGMPFGANNSLVLAAACHPRLKEWNEHVALSKVKWGVNKDTLNEETGVAHCAISNEQVDFPTVGQEYA